MDPADRAPGRVLIVLNASDSGPRGLPGVLREHGLEPEVVDATREPLPPDLAGYSGLVLLGGGLMPDDDARGPWLPAERRLAARAVRDDLPTLGVCLGAQVIAVAAGGRVRANGPDPERGIYHVDLSPDAAGDALFAPFAERTHPVPAEPASSPEAPCPPTVVENHRDLITALPPSATLLATTPHCPVQAFRIGRRVWGVQFHPEAPPERVLEFDPATLAAEGIDPGELRNAVATRGDTVRASSAALLGAFAKVVATREVSRDL